MCQAMRFLFALVVVLVFVTQGAVPGQPLVQSPQTVEAQIKGISDDRYSLQISYQGKSESLTVKSKELRTLLKEFRAGDEVEIEMTQEGDQKVLQRLSPLLVTREARIEDISEDRSSLKVSYQEKLASLTVKSKELQTLLKKFKIGDKVKIEVEKEGNQMVLKDLSPLLVTREALIEALSEDRSSLRVSYQEKSQKKWVSLKSVSLTVESKELQTLLEKFRMGDRVEIEVAKEKEGDRMVLQSLSSQKVSVGPAQRFLVLVASALIAFILAKFLLWKRLRMLIIGEDNRYSNSKFQIVSWFSVLLVTYIAIIGLRVWTGGWEFIGGVNIPQNLLILSGISALTFAGAKLITQAKVNTAEKEAAEATAGDITAKEEAAKAAAEKVKPPADRPRFPSDLFCDDKGNPDIGDFQTVIITLLAVVVYFLGVYHFLGSIELLKVVTIPDVDTTILATFGLGQGAYLAKKYAGEGR